MNKLLVAIGVTVMICNEMDFVNWLDHQLSEVIPESIIAFNININESPFNLELVGSNEFDPEDEDWACNEDWAPKNRTMEVSESLFGKSWEVAESQIFAFAKAFMSSDLNSAVKLRGAKAFAVGFVDGNLKFVI